MNRAIGKATVSTKMIPKIQDWPMNTALSWEHHTMNQCNDHSKNGFETKPNLEMVNGIMSPTKKASNVFSRKAFRIPKIMKASSPSACGGMKTGPWWMQEVLKPTLRYWKAS